MTDNGMTVEHEILQILQEECGELIQAASKIIRFGWTDQNKQRLAEELGDLQCMLNLMHQFDMYSYTDVDAFCEAKAEKLKKYSNIYTNC